jgi:hypothetical protein
VTDVQWSNFREGEFEIIEEEQLWRQVHPSQYDAGIVAKTVFLPSARDDSRLSASRSSIIAAKDAYREYVEDFELESCGVLSVNVSEIKNEDLRSVDDSNSAAKPDPCPTGHAYIDFRRVVQTSKRKRIAAKLRDAATSRPWAY